MTYYDCTVLNVHETPLCVFFKQNTFKYKRSTPRTYVLTTTLRQVSRRVVAKIFATCKTVSASIWVSVKDGLVGTSLTLIVTAARRKILAGVVFHYAMTQNASN